MTTKKLYVWIVFISIFVLMLGLSVGYDTWWHLKTGELIWETRSVINTDPFSYTKLGEQWYGPATNWLAELSLFAMFKILSYSGLMLWVAILMTASFYFIYRAMEKNIYWNGFVMILGVIVMSAYRLPRPVLVSTLMVSIFLWQFEQFRKNKDKKLFILPILMIIWANSHGGILLAVLIWGVYFVNELIEWIKTGLCQNTKGFKFCTKKTIINALKGRIGHLILIFILLIVALSINPEGPRMIIYTFEQMDVELALENIQEWKSPNFHILPMQVMLGIFVLSIILMVLNKKKILLTDTLLILGFMSMTFMYSRFLPYAILAAMLVLSRYGNYLIEEIVAFVESRKTNKREPKKLPENIAKIVNLGLFILIIVTACVIVLDQYIINNPVNDYLETRFPVKAVEKLKENGVEGNLFNRYGYGGYIIWEMPETPVFIDGRADLYQDEFLTEYYLINNAEDGWQDALSKWNIRTVLIEPTAGLAKVLPYENWEMIYQDEMAIIYIKNE